MCNFHESVAIAAATDPVTGKVHAGHKAVLRVALSRYWASSYIQGAENVDGYNFYPLATQEQQSAFALSGLKRPMAEVQRNEEEGIAFLRRRISELEQAMDLSPKTLKLPVPTARSSFIDLAIDKIYEGDPKGDFNVAESVDRADLEPLRRAISVLHSDKETSEVLERLVKGKICALYTDAPERVNATLINAYERLPEQAKETTRSLAQYGGNFLLGGFSGLVGHSVHYASVLGAGVAAGAASNLNMGLSAVFLAASFGAWHQAFGGQYRAAKEQVGAFVVQAALTFAVAVSAQELMPHNHINHERMEMYDALSPDDRSIFANAYRGQYESLPEELQERLEVRARESGVPPEILLAICSSDDPLSQEVTAYLASQSETTSPIVERVPAP